MARKYELNKRAEKQEATRRQIIEATVALHEEIGPARTSISAIAERAGVERLTVYRHFPDEREIFNACARRFNEEHPFPDASAWLDIADPVERLTVALQHLYRYYAATKQMLSNVFRDAPLMPAMSGPFNRALQRVESTVDLLAAGWQVEDEATQRAISAAIRLGLDFNSWRVLTTVQGLSSDAAAGLVADMISSLTFTPLRS